MKKNPTPKPVHNGIRWNGKLYKGYRSFSGEDTGDKTKITFHYLKFDRLPKEIRDRSGVEIINETDSQTDYFDHDRFIIYPENRIFLYALGVIIEDEEKLFFKRSLKEPNFYGSDVISMYIKFLKALFKTIIKGNK